MSRPALAPLAGSLALADRPRRLRERRRRRARRQHRSERVDDRRHRPRDVARAGDHRAAPRPSASPTASRPSSSSPRSRRARASRRRTATRCSSTTSACAPRTATQFDTNFGGDPIAVTLGAGGVIAGWDQGLVGTTQGQRVQLDIPNDLAYGDEPRGDVIQAGDALSFVVDVLAVVPPITAVAPTAADLPLSSEVTTESEVVDLVEGDGATLEAGQTGVFHFVAARADDGTCCRRRGTATRSRSPWWRASAIVPPIAVVAPTPADLPLSSELSTEPEVVDLREGDGADARGGPDRRVPPRRRPRRRRHRAADDVGQRPDPAHARGGELVEEVITGLPGMKVGGRRLVRLPARPGRRPRTRRPTSSSSPTCSPSTDPAPRRPRRPGRRRSADDEVGLAGHEPGQHARPGRPRRATRSPDVGLELPAPSTELRWRKMAAAYGASPGASPDRFGPMLASIRAAAE